MYHLPKPIHDLYRYNQEYKDARFYLLIQLCEEKVRANKWSYQDKWIIEYCDLSKNSFGKPHSSVEYATKQALYEACERVHGKLGEKEVSKIKGFEAFVNKAFTFGFMVEAKDIDEYLLTGTIRLYAKDVHHRNNAVENSAYRQEGAEKNVL